MPVQGRKFIIVGGAGLVGRAVAHKLIAAHSVDVVICDRFGEVSCNKWANLPAAIDDIWKPQDLLLNLDKSWREIAGVIVLADDGHAQQDGDALFEAAFHLPRRIWDFCVAKQRPLAWASSSHVYGNGQSQLSTAPDDVIALQPVTPFGRAKQAFDVFAARQGTGPDTPPVWAGYRLSSIYGARENHKAALASLPVRAMKAARAQTQLHLWDDSLAHARDWIAVDDAAAIVADLAVGQHAGFFDVGTGIATTTTELISLVEVITGKSLDLDTVPKPMGEATSFPAANLMALMTAGIATQFRTLEQGLTEL